MRVSVVVFACGDGGVKSGGMMSVEAVVRVSAVVFACGGGGVAVGFIPPQRNNVFISGNITEGYNILFVATMPSFGGPGHPLPQDREVPWPQAATILIHHVFWCQSPLLRELHDS